MTLKHGETADDQELGTVSLENGTSLTEVERQAEHVVQRLRHVSKDLQTVRSEVVRSERLAAVGELAAGVAHELRNPLTSVKLLLQHSLKQTGRTELSDSKLRLILDEIGRMEMTIQGLLDFSRPRPLKRSRHDIRDSVQRALNLVSGRAHQQRIEISAVEYPMPLVVDGDIEQLQQVFVNLLINATEAISERGQVIVDYGVSEDHGMVSVRIQDTGCGISPEVLPRLFEPFATSKEKGTGLGLAVSRRIVEEHGGALTADNRASGGACFTVTLPAVIAQELAVCGPAARFERTVSQ